MLQGGTRRRAHVGRWRRPLQYGAARSLAAPGVVLGVVLGVVIGTALAACANAPVAWSDVQYVAAPVVADADTSGALPAGACPGSLRVAHAGGDTYGAWWGIRPDSSSALVAGRSTDGGRTWLVTAVADSTDRSRRGCARPAPAVAADATTHYFDVAYFLEPSDGAGIFFTHTMDAPHLGTTNAVFHAPVPVMYGAHPAHVAVATHGDDVAVAYEDPNSERETVGIALSRTMGHLFDVRAIASDPDLPATTPRVSLERDTVVVEWAERPDSVVRGGRIAVRRAVWER